jgi:hypothetical protein
MYGGTILVSFDVDNLNFDILLLGIYDLKQKM